MNENAETRLVQGVGAELLAAVKAAGGTSGDREEVAAAAERALASVDSSDPHVAHRRRVGLVGYLAMFAVEAFAQPSREDLGAFLDRVAAEFSAR